jgi:tetratricopeptide (TPR) repeat protein
MSAPLLVNAGLALLDPADPTEALAYMDKARALDPEGWLWAEGKANVLAFAGRFDEALHWHLEALRLDPRSGYALAGVAHWHLELDDLVGARSWLERATADGREIAGAFGHAGLLDLYSGESARAVAFARRAMAYDPRDPKAFMVLDAEALRRGDTAAVIANVHSSFPELAASEPPRIRRAAVLPATDLALALRLAGDAAASDALLEAVARFLEAARRNGSAEFATDEIRVAAVRGERERALQLLGNLVAGGWHGAYWRYFRDHDPALDSLRADPRFRKAFAVVESDIRAQRERAAKSGDLGRVP